MNNNIKKIALVTTSINYGGISSYLINFANYLSLNNDVTIFCTSISEYRRELLNNNIKISIYHRPKPKSIFSLIYYFFHGRILSALKIFFRKKKEKPSIKSIQRIGYLDAKRTKIIVNDYDIAISSAEFYCNYLVAKKINAPKKIAWIHPDINSLVLDYKLSERISCFFNYICVVSETCKKSFIKYFPKLADKTVVVENITDQISIKKMSRDTISNEWFLKNGLNVITVGRFDNSAKRFDRIVKACRFLKEKNINFVWNIIGDGVDFDFVKNMAFEYDVLDVLHFLGKKDNPYPYIFHSDIFVLSSQYEGKPIVIDEAIAIGIPCIVTNYASAKKQVKPEFGFVVPNDDDGFVEQLFNIIIDEKIQILKGNLKHYKLDNKNIYDVIDRIITD